MLNSNPTHIRKSSLLHFLLGSLTIALTILLTTSRIFAQQPAATTPAHNGLFAVKVTGSGSPIILIPGLSSSGDVWDGTVAHLSPTYQCHVLTLAGYAGQPAWPNIDNGKFLTSVEDELAAYIRDQKLQKPIVIGHSLGGTLALHFAERYPDLAGRLVIVDSLSFLAGAFFQVDTVAQGTPIAANMKNAIKGETQEQYEQFVKSGASTRSMVTSDADFATVTKWGLASDKVTVADSMYELLTLDARPQLGSIQQKALIFGTWAGQPGATSKQVEAVFDEQYKNLKSKQIVMAEKERHFIMLDNPTWFYSQVDAFLATPATVSQLR